MKGRLVTLLGGSGSLLANTRWERSAFKGLKNLCKGDFRWAPMTSVFGRAAPCALALGIVAAGIFLVTLPPLANAGPGPCITGPDGVITCTGDQSNGIASGPDFSAPPATTLYVNSLTSPIEPSSGITGIDFNNTGSSVNIVSGVQNSPVVIATQGDNAVGINALSTGSPANYAWLNGLGVYVPTGPSGGGGQVTVESYSNITTSGANSHGIFAQNSIGVYNPLSTSTLESFSTNNVNISLVSVAGNSANIGNAVAGDNGGLFTLNSDGTVKFDVAKLAGSLQVGESIVTKLDYQVQISSSLGSQTSDGSIAVKVTNDNGTIETTQAIYFKEFDVFSDTTGTNPLWPNLQGYVDRLLADEGVAGAGDSISVTNGGRIKTTGSNAYGIYAETKGGNGSNGQSGTFWDANQIPQPGGAGSNGGAVTIVHDGTIITTGDSSSGIVVGSQGGTGGNGGDGGPWRDARRGGTGGTGGDITITGSGKIYTEGDSASGIMVASVGGMGGTGGSGTGFTNGASGGFGGTGGTVTIDGSWTILTEGSNAYGIWGKSAGGQAGSGGSGGWLFGNPGSGGEGADGGIVNITNGGHITTRGTNSYGIYAESIGGFGGSGSYSWGLFWAAGGDGGSGGSGGDVTVINNAGGSITTHGDGAHAIYAESVGGGGGSGEGVFGFFASLGGNGDAGGNGGTVNVTNNAVIKTKGDYARGIYAQSIGGGGGDGGLGAGIYAVGGNADLGDPSSYGGNVTIVNSGSIKTRGNESDAIYAESVGGGGGSAVTSGGVVAVGGNGGSGGDGGTVTVTNNGTITTEGLDSRGISVQSVGGGGGNGGGGGGFVFTGGNGAAAGDGGEVTVINTGKIETMSDLSSAIYAQSVGGGGGSGGSTKTYSIGSDFSLNIAVGGDGGAAGDGGMVTVDNENIIGTLGENSHGIVAQSVGGGGGDGGSSYSFNLLLPPVVETPANVQFSISLGGNGNAAGDGGVVNVTNEDEITTTGFRSHGILAESIGGGGGDGGSSTSFYMSMDSTISGNISIGGAGGAGGKGNIVTVNNSGVITTEGDDSVGILAQSVGGGGGSGGDSSVFSINFDVPLGTNDIVPKLSSDVTITIGGAAGTGGNGNSVDVTNGNTIKTSGIFAHGILAQSIGGSGGVGGDARTTDISLSFNPTVILPYVNWCAESTKITLSGSGGDGGDGGTVTVTNNGTITTQGASAHGIVAQSIGGGGGAGGSALTVNFINNTNAYNSLPGYSMNNFEATLEGGSGGSGNGQDVTVTNNGTITTQGASAHGILAQSIGGGGGFVGIVNPLGVTTTDFEGSIRGILIQTEGVGASFMGSLGGSGDGGTVTVTNNGTIITQGASAHGIVAQSAGGSSGGTVNVTTSGNIVTQGVDSDGILAQSIGWDGNGDISVTINSGTVQGGSGTGAGVYFMDGANNSLDNSGTITTVNSINGTAVQGTSGNETINNYGTITGSVDLGSGHNAFNNNPTAVLNAGVVLNLGAGNTLTNSGTLSPGGPTTPITTTLTGNLVQTGSGVFEADVHADGTHDTLLVNGGSASLAGTLLVTKGPGLYKDGTKYDIIEVSGPQSISGTFSTLLLPDPRPLLSFNINQQPNLVEVETHAPSFASIATNPRELATSEYLDRISPMASGNLLNVLAEFQSLPASQLSTALSSLSPASYDNYTRTSFISVGQYTESLERRMNNVRLYSALGQDTESKPVLLTFAGSDADLDWFLPSDQLSQTQGRSGLWLNGYEQWGKQQDKPDFAGFGYRIGGATIGFDRTLSDNLMAGVSFGYSGTDVNLDLHQGNGYIMNLSGSLYGSYFTENGYVEGAISYGRNQYSNHRFLTIGALQSEADSDHDGDLFSAYLGGGYYFHANGWRVGPFASLRYIYLNEEGFTETGADSLDLTVDRRATDSLVSELGLRAARAFKTTNGNLIPELSAALNYDFDTNDGMITSSFTGSPGAEFSIKGYEVEKYGVVVGAGLTFVHKSGISAALKYNGEFREKYQAHGILGQLRYSF